MGIRRRRQGERVTDKQVFMTIKRLDALIMGSRRDLESATSELANLINAVHELRADRNDWREEAQELGREASAKRDLAKLP